MSDSALGSVLTSQSTTTTLWSRLRLFDLSTTALRADAVDTTIDAERVSVRCGCIESKCMGYEDDDCT